MFFIVKIPFLDSVCRKVRFWQQKALIFRWKSIPKSHAKHAKKFTIFILCYKCIVWCWGAWRVDRNVCGALQTRKIIKITACFGEIHYNRVLNRNAHRLMFIMPASFWGAPEHRTQSDLTSRLFGFRSWASRISPSYAATPFTVVFVSIAPRSAAAASLRQVLFSIGFVTNHRVQWHASVNPIIWCFFKSRGRALRMYVAGCHA